MIKVVFVESYPHVIAGQRADHDGIVRTRRPETGFSQSYL